MPNIWSVKGTSICELEFLCPCSTNCNLSSSELYFSFIKVILSSNLLRFSVDEAEE